MATYTAHHAKSLTGGGAGALDAIAVTSISDNDIAIVVTSSSGITYTYEYDSSSTATESSPVIIKPDDNTGNGRWLLVSNPIDIQRGFLVRPKFSWKDVNNVYLGPGAYHTFDGTNHRIVYWVSQLDYAWANKTATDWSYLYLDESAIDTMVGTAGAALITTTQLIDSTTEPAWDHSKGGWYNGSDRCIFANPCDGTPESLEFFHNGNLVLFADEINDQAAIDIDLTWTDIGTSAYGDLPVANKGLTIPKFATVAVVQSYTSANTIFVWRTNGQTASNGHQVHVSENRMPIHEVITDSSQIIEYKKGSSDATTITIDTQGWKFPVGM